MTVSDLLELPCKFATSLIISTRLLTACSKLVDNLEQLWNVHLCTHVVTNLFTSCRQVVFALLVPSCCNKFGTSCQQLVTSLMALSNSLQACCEHILLTSCKIFTCLQPYNNRWYFFQAVFSWSLEIRITTSEYTNCYLVLQRELPNYLHTWY
jgi:hypothetical protein